MNILRFLVFFLLGAFSSVHADSLLQQAKDKLEAGYYREAELELAQLAEQAAVQKNEYDITLIAGLQGLTALYKQHYLEAEQLLTVSINTAKTHSWHDLTALFSLHLGQLHGQQGELAQAQQDNAQAIMWAQKLNDKSLLISARTHAAKLALALKNVDNAWSELQQIQTLLETLPVDINSSQLWLNSGYQLLQLHLTQPQFDNYLAASYYHLNKALIQSRQNKNIRLQVSTLKYLAQLYSGQKRENDAIQLLLEAITLAQQENADDSLLDLEWQLAEIYKTQNQSNQAIAAYKRALQHLETIRLDIPVSYEKGQSSFKTTFAPLYLGLADLLLKQAPKSNQAENQKLLHEAQDAIELMKKSELEDYFQSRCTISAEPLDLKKTDSHAAAIYPILLPDRLEIIVYTADGLHQFTQPITRQLIEQQARLFTNQLRNYIPFNKFKNSAEFLYNAMIKPILPLLKEKHIDTLVYVPDGALRSIPLSALYDGKTFLIEQYAVVNSPGLSLIAKGDIDYTGQAILFAGISQPGNAIYELPDSLLIDLLNDFAKNTPAQRYLNELRPIMQKRGLNETEQVEKTRALRELLTTRAITEKLKQALALPGVDTEIKQLAAQNNMPYSLNEDFSLANFSYELTAKPHKILHIASHGFFGTTTQESFIMTYDKILTMDNLENLLTTPYFKKYPLDLIVLSACQTAEGDDRSPLGISGIAIKAKVHSALGSLWSVSDEATAQLMTNFYAALKKPNYNKAKALQEAEISLLKNFNNLSLWSPFVLVGNWW